MSKLGRPALEYVQKNGWAVIALAPNSKMPRKDSGAYKDATSNVAEVEKLWSEHPHSNVGVATGERSNIVVVDIDVKHGAKGEESALALDLPETLEASTPSGGRHLYYQYPRSGTKVGREINWRPGIDLLGDAGYVVAPPSVTDKGEYRWANNLEPAPFPEGLLVPRCDDRGSGGNGRRENGVIPKGTRDDFLFKIACALRAKGYEQDQIEQRLLEINAKRCEPQLPEEQVKQKAAQAAKYPRGESEEDLERKVAELAALSELAYAQRRRAEAEALHVPIKILDKAVLEKRKASGKSPKPQLVLDVEPWTESVDGGELIEELRSVLNEYLDLPEKGDLVIALWILHTWTIDASYVSPILAITSPDKECGKSTVLKLLKRLVCRPAITANMTAATLFRVIEAHSPTLLIDEADSFLSDQESLRNVLNAGHDRENAFVWRCQAETNEPEAFYVYGPKSIAVIGRLPETLMNRSIEIGMRRTTDRTLKKVRASERGPFEKLQRKCARWGQDQLENVRHVRPTIPDDIFNRAEDNWFELLRIAAVAEVMNDALAALRAWVEKDHEPGIKEQLLSDIRDLFSNKGVFSLPSEALCQRLAGMEDRPWAEWRKGFPISTNQLARLLKPYGIKPKQYRRGETIRRGYEKGQFRDAWRRYLGQQTVTPVTNETAQTVTPFQNRDKQCAASRADTARNPRKTSL